MVTHLVKVLIAMAVIVVKNQVAAVAFMVEKITRIVAVVVQVTLVIHF